MRSLIVVDEGPLRSQILCRLEETSEELKKLEVAIEGYFSRDLPQYQAWIDTQFGHLIAAIHEMEKKLQSLGRRVEETLQLSLQMEVAPEKIFAHVSEQKESSESCESFQENVIQSVQQKKLPASYETKEIFRRFVRALHPDLRGQSLNENEKNLWVAAQKAYARNDSFELHSLEKQLQTGSCSRIFAFSEIQRQYEEFRQREKELRCELSRLESERAWSFSQRRDMHKLERDLEAEFSLALRELQKKEKHLMDTVDAWIKPQSKMLNLPKKCRMSKIQAKKQASLFDA